MTWSELHEISRAVISPRCFSCHLFLYTNKGISCKQIEMKPHILPFWAKKYWKRIFLNGAHHTGAVHFKSELKGLRLWRKMNGAHHTGAVLNWTVLNTYIRMLFSAKKGWNMTEIESCALCWCRFTLKKASNIFEWCAPYTSRFKLKKGQTSKGMVRLNFTASRSSRSSKFRCKTTSNKEWTRTANYTQHTAHSTQQAKRSLGIQPDLLSSPTAGCHFKAWVSFGLTAEDNIAYLLTLLLCLVFSEPLAQCFLFRQTTLHTEETNWFHILILLYT